MLTKNQDKQKTGVLVYKYIRTAFFKTINAIVKIFLEIFVFDKQIRRILKGKSAKLYLKKYVKKACKITPKEPQDKEKPRIIWQFWEQGWDNAPQIIKSCTESVEKHKNNCEHIYLDMNNLKDYIEIPDYIYKLKEKGIIKSAHFSDIIRTYLLCKHGGTWVDATVFFTDDLPEFIIKSDLFVFQNELRLDLDGLNMASYFMSAKPNNFIMLCCKTLFEIYWMENLFLNNYFMFLHGFTMITQQTKENKDAFLRIPFVDFVPVQRFQSEIIEQYDKEKFELVKKRSFAHKLSFKQKVLNKKNKELDKTFLEKLLDGELG